jgi:predicted DNA-binding transcriptional regulator AlpA
MPISLHGQTYYRTMEVCRIVGISKNTLFRWMKKGMFERQQYRDGRGWRLFAQSQVDALKTRTQQINIQDNTNRPMTGVGNVKE